MPSIHRPVLFDEVIEWLAPRPGGVIVDATLGAGGHARAIAERLGPDGLLIGLDRDASMIERARERLEGVQAELVREPFDRIEAVLDHLGRASVSGVLADLGFASDQIEAADRGFSFQADGPLDMRYDRSGGPTAAAIVNTWPFEDLQSLFQTLGEEPKARAIAERIVRVRTTTPIETTGRLAAIVRSAASRGGRDRIDPATRIFQALRIRVNDELERLERLLAAVPERLEPSGRFVIISFHSLEDRRVKSAFRDDERLRPLTKTPVIARDRELRSNPRARTAKLRAAERR